MSKIIRVNIYFVIILLLEIFMPSLLYPVYKTLGLVDLRFQLLLNHTVLFLIPATIYIIVTKSNIKETFRLNKLYIKDFFMIVVLAFICQPIMAFFSVVTGLFFPNNVGALITTMTQKTPYIIMLLLVAVMPAITEEVTIRGVVLSGYDKKNKFIAALITGVMFGVFHLDAQQFLYAAVLGFILAYVVRITNSIFASVVMHFIINGTSITMQYILSMFGGIVDVSSTQTELIGLSLAEKLSIMKIYGLIGVTFAVLAYLIIKALEKWNNERKQGV